MSVGLALSQMSVPFPPKRKAGTLGTQCRAGGAVHIHCHQSSATIDQSAWSW